MSVDGHVRVASPTEGRNPRTHEIDLLPTVEVLRRINEEDRTVAPAVGVVLPLLADAVDRAWERLRRGGDVHYFGAGTSGRVGVQDAAELPPTFSVAPGRFVAHQAGGDSAVQRARESAEDRAALGAADAAGLRRVDVVVGLTASGRTPYVRGVLETAATAGALRLLVTANPHAELASLADVHVGVDTGPEVIAGSTRMKAGTAQKLVLNAFSTALMIRLGKTWSNLMVDVVARNDKLRGRVLTILEEATGADEARCAAALAAADGDTKVALVCLLGDTTAPAARAALARADGVPRTALALLPDPPAP